MALSFRFRPFGELLGQRELGDMKTAAQIHDLSGVDRAGDVHHRQLPGLGGDDDDTADLPVLRCLEEDVGVFAVALRLHADKPRPARPLELRANRVHVGLVISAISGELESADVYRLEAGHQLLRSSLIVILVGEKFAREAQQGAVEGDFHGILRLSRQPVKIRRRLEFLSPHARQTGGQNECRDSHTLSSRSGAWPEHSLHKMNTRDYRMRTQNLAIKTGPRGELYRRAGRRWLFIAQGDDRVEAGGAGGGPDAEEQSDTDRYGNTQDGSPQGHGRGEARKDEARGERNQPAEEHAEHAAEHGEHHRFGQKLQHDVAAARADGFADADLARTFGDRHQHDVHYADTAYQQADGTKYDDHERHHGGDFVEVLHHLLGGGDGKAVGLIGGHAPLDAQHGAHFVLGLGHHARISDDDQHVLARVGEQLL